MPKFNDLFLASSVSSPNQISINMTLSTSLAQVGETLQAVCNVTNKQRHTFILIWIRKLPERGQEVEIATNQHLNEAFQQTGRYTGTIYQDAPDDIRTVSFSMIISSESSFKK